MACYHPLQAYLRDDGTLSFVNNRVDGNSITLRCGWCVGCRLDRAHEWATRCMHEASLHDANSFVTLTYDDDHMPVNRSLHYPDFQKFLKRLRKRVGKVRYYMCGEYGEGLGRPHYHACIFGYQFPDLSYWRTNANGDKTYRSALLSDLWPLGHSLVGDVTYQSAAYCARYLMDKKVGDHAEGWYNCIDLDTGEVYERSPEFNHMSTNPGIGAEWLRLYWQDVYSAQPGKVIVEGSKRKAPRYYDKLAAKLGAFEDAQYSRFVSHVEHIEDFSAERLAVREEVHHARVALLKRNNPMEIVQ